MCLLSPSEREKQLSHRVHLKGFSPVCERKCRRSSEALKKHIPQSAQQWGFSGCSSCVFSCALQWPDSENPFPQTEHVKGLSPVCIRLWRTSLLSLLNVFMQYEHWWGTFGFFECVRLCLSNFEGLLKTFPQSGQGCLLVLLWQFWCLSSFSCCVKVLSQCWHWWRVLGFLVCTGLCLSSFDGLSNTLPQMEQGKHLSDTLLPGCLEFSGSVAVEASSDSEMTFTTTSPGPEEQSHPRISSEYFSEHIDWKQLSAEYNDSFYQWLILHNYQIKLRTRQKHVQCDKHLQSTFRVAGTFYWIDTQSSAL